jgi:hypothetical protein
MLKLHVDSYSGRKADERPVRFRLGDREYLVQEVLDQWYGPDEVFFKILRVTAIFTSFGIARWNGRPNGRWNPSGRFAIDALATCAVVVASS